MVDRWIGRGIIAANSMTKPRVRRTTHVRRTTYVRLHTISRRITMTKDTRTEPRFNKQTMNPAWADAVLSLTRTSTDEKRRDFLPETKKIVQNTTRYITYSTNLQIQCLRYRYIHSHRSCTWRPYATEIWLCWNSAGIAKVFHTSSSSAVAAAAAACCVCKQMMWQFLNIQYRIKLQLNE